MEEALGANKGNGDQKRRFTIGEKDIIHTSLWK